MGRPPLAVREKCLLLPPLRRSPGRGRRCGNGIAVGPGPPVRTRGRQKKKKRRKTAVTGEPAARHHRHKMSGSTRSLPHGHSLGRMPPPPLLSRRVASFCPPPPVVSLAWRRGKWPRLRLWGATPSPSQREWPPPPPPTKTACRLHGGTSRTGLAWRWRRWAPFVPTPLHGTTPPPPRTRTWPRRCLMACNALSPPPPLPPLWPHCRPPPVTAALRRQSLDWKRLSDGIRRLLPPPPPLRQWWHGRLGIIWCCRKKAMGFRWKA